MKPVLKTLAGILAGVGIAFVLVVAVEWFGAISHPLPADFNGTAEQMCLHVERFPAWVLAAVVPMWAAVGFAGAWTALKVGNRFAVIAVGVFLLSMLVLNISMLPYPFWFEAANLIALPAACLLGGRSQKRRGLPASDVG